MSKTPRSTNLEALQDAFKKVHTLTTEIIRGMFPNSAPATLVWHLENRKGLVFERKREGKRIVAYTYQPDQSGVIIKGSKKDWKRENKAV